MSHSFPLQRIRAGEWRLREHALRLYCLDGQWYVQALNGDTLRWLVKYDFLGPYRTRTDLLHLLADQHSREPLPLKPPPSISLHRTGPASYLSSCGRARVEWSVEQLCWMIRPEPGWRTGLPPRRASTLPLAREAIGFLPFKPV